MKITHLEQLTLDDLVRDGGIGILKKTGNRKNWVTAGLKQSALDTRALTGLVHKELVNMLDGRCEAIGSVEPNYRPTPLRVQDMGWLG